MTIRLETLSDLKDQGYSLHVYCNEVGCGLNVPLKLDALIAKFGAKFGYLGKGLGSRMRCQCGKKNASVQLHPPRRDGELQ